MPLPAQAGYARPVLKARHLSLSEELAGNPFNRPLCLESSQTRSSLEDQFYALADQPKPILSIGFGKMQNSSFTEVNPLFCASQYPVHQPIQRWILDILVPSMLTPAIKPC
jgi:hypothetical protein